MTRINVVPVKELTNKHLVAEYREIMRLPKNLNTSLNRKGKPFNMNEIPEDYVLGSGHVKFLQEVRNPKLHRDQHDPTLVHKLDRW